MGGGDTYVHVFLEVDVVVLRLVRFERLQSDPRLADEVEADRVLVEDGQTDRLLQHVVVRDAVVGEHLVPLRIQRLRQSLGAQLEGLTSHAHWTAWSAVISNNNTVIHIAPYP